MLDKYHEMGYFDTHRECPRCHTDKAPVKRNKGNYICPKCMFKDQIEEWYKE